MTNLNAWLLNIDIIVTNISVIIMCFAVSRQRKRMDFLEAMHFIRLNHAELLMTERMKDYGK